MVTREVKEVGDRIRQIQLRSILRLDHTYGSFLEFMALNTESDPILRSAALLRLDPQVSRGVFEKLASGKDCDALTQRTAIMRLSGRQQA